MTIYIVNGSRVDFRFIGFAFKNIRDELLVARLGQWAVFQKLKERSNGISLIWA